MFQARPSKWLLGWQVAQANWPMLTILIMYYATALTKNQFEALRQVRHLLGGELFVQLRLGRLHVRLYGRNLQDWLDRISID